VISIGRGGSCCHSALGQTLPWRPLSLTSALLPKSAQLGSFAPACRYGRVKATSARTAGGAPPRRIGEAEKVDASYLRQAVSPAVDAALQMIRLICTTTAGNSCATAVSRNTLVLDNRPADNETGAVIRRAIAVPVDRGGGG
jgi:hypothetical protein